MNILDDIINSEDKDIIIHLAKNKTWLEYLSYFMELRAASENFYVIVDTAPRTSAGKKCHIVFDGLLKGCMEIYRLKETSENDICIELIPSVTLCSRNVATEYFDGYKYIFDNSNTQ